MSPRAIAVVMICVIGGAALIVARQSARDGDADRAAAPIVEASAAAVPQAGAAPARPAMKRTVTKSSAVEDKKKPAIEDSPAATRTPAPPVQTNGNFARVVQTTITGCLERREDGFWLAKTNGDDAPKARSWKTGFLTKRPSAIRVVDDAHALQLPSHVGQRVAATGMLADREMQAHTLKRVGTSCE